jgi:hypothetical protein
MWKKKTHKSFESPHHLNLKYPKYLMTQIHLNPNYLMYLNYPNCPMFHLNHSFLMNLMYRLTLMSH